MKVESKAQLRERIAQMEKENIRLSREAEAAQQEAWLRKIPEATKAFHGAINAVFPNVVYNPKFEHVDASGYWFSFTLVNDMCRTQNFVVRHNEV